MRLARNEAKSRGLVDASRSREVALCPEHDLPVAGAPRERDAGAGQAPPKAPAARFRVENEEPQLCGGPGVPDQEHRPDEGPIHFRDPATLAFRLEIAHEAGGD